MKRLSAILLACLVAEPMAAQVVAGRVVALPDKTPVAGITAALLGDSARVLLRVQSDSAGIFELKAPAPGTYHVLLLRADGGSFLTPGFNLRETDYIERQFLLPALPSESGEVYLFGDVDQPAKPLPRNQPPRFPDDLRSRGRGGLVNVLFVVDTLGHPEPASITVLSTDDAQFGDAVRKVLPVWLFTPALRGGKFVRQVVQYSVDFGFGNDPPRGELIIRAMGLTRRGRP